MQTSKLVATSGRIVLVTMAGVNGQRPAIVVGSPVFDGDRQLVNANVFLDGANDKDALAIFRARDQGNTLTSIPLYDPDVTPENVASEGGAFAQWMPYQTSQAQKTANGEERVESRLRTLAEQTEAQAKRLDDALNRLAQLEQRPGPRLATDTEDTIDADARRAIDHLAVHISNDGTDIRQCVTNILTGKPPHGEDGEPPHLKH